MSEERVCSRCVELGFAPWSDGVHRPVDECRELPGRKCIVPEEHHSPVWRKRHIVISLCTDCGAQVDPFDYEECRA